MQRSWLESDLDSGNDLWFSPPLQDLQLESVRAEIAINFQLVMETLQSSHHIASWIRFRQGEGCEVEAVSEDKVEVEVED